MQKLFGTDGVRENASSSFFNRKSMYAFAKAIVNFIELKNSNQQLKILIGMDGRHSGAHIQNLLFEGLLLNNTKISFCDYVNTNNSSTLENKKNFPPLTIIPTPFLSRMVKKYFDFGIMITASHNPSSDNGIKLFNENGEKLLKEEENQIEDLFFKSYLVKSKENLSIQKNILNSDILLINDKELSIYKKNFNINNIKLVIDCANGGMSLIATKIFNHENHLIYNNQPDGYNINSYCGSEFPEKLTEKVLDYQADIGIAFDGDGDRLVVSDENGCILSGEKILGIFAQYFKDQGLLKNNTVVTTCMSNIALYKYLKELEINVITTDVGDRNLLYKMKENKVILGGENSGHFIINNFCSCGDGLLSALILIDIIKKSGKKLSELSSIFTLYPQKLINVNISKKPPLENLVSLQKILNDAENELRERGRVLIRYSGTESICRVMVEGDSDYLVEKYSKLISVEIERLIG